MAKQDAPSIEPQLYHLYLRPSSLVFNVNNIWITLIIHLFRIGFNIRKHEIFKMAGIENRYVEGSNDGIKPSWFCLYDCNLDGTMVKLSIRRPLQYQHVGQDLPAEWLGLPGDTFIFIQSKLFYLAPLVVIEVLAVTIRSERGIQSTTYWLTPKLNLSDHVRTT